MRTISVAHSFFGFDMFFLVKGIRLSAWGAEDINIGRTGLTNINFAGISSQVNFIDTMKYFLTSLGQLVSTLDEVEKARLKKLTLQFLNQHSYFSRTWRILNEWQKGKLLDINVSGKGIIPYEKINSIDSLNIKPENGICFSKDKFYSTLKGKTVSDDEYDNSKKLYTVLKMRDLSDLNNLYNAQDVIPLLEIIENRFPVMYDKTMYNPTKCNSASKLSSCIQCEQSNVILALPTSNSIMEIFEKSLTGGLVVSVHVCLLVPNF